MKEILRAWIGAGHQLLSKEAGRGCGLVMKLKQPIGAWGTSSVLQAAVIAEFDLDSDADSRPTPPELLAWRVGGPVRTEKSIVSFTAAPPEASIAPLRISVRCFPYHVIGQHQPQS